MSSSTPDSLNAHPRRWRAADLFGPKRLVMSGLVVFTIASLVTGLASGAEMAIGGRIGQGVGAAMLSPAALSVVVRTCGDC